MFTAAVVPEVEALLKNFQAWDLPKSTTYKEAFQAINKMKKSLLLLFTVLLILSCNKTNKNTYSTIDKKTESNKEHPGKKLMEINCYVCHSPTASHDNRVAPPMVAIKKHYINDKTSKEDFINSMLDWIKNPTKENAKMFGAINKFGIMPKQAYPDETIEQIADYMFDNDMEAPEWFEEHLKTQQ